MIQGIFKSPFLRYIKSLYNDEYLSNDSYELATLKRFQHISDHVHKFAINEVTSIAWCDKCDGIIFGVQTVVYKCLDCNYTCHAECHPSANLSLNLHEQQNTSQPSGDFVGVTDRRLTLKINYELENLESTSNPSQNSLWNLSILNGQSSEENSLTNSQSSLCYSNTDSSSTTNTLKSINDDNTNMESSYIRFDDLTEDENSSWAPSPLSSVINHEFNETIPSLTHSKVKNDSSAEIGAYIQLGVNILRPIYVAPGQKLASLNHLPSTPNLGQGSSAIMLADEAQTTELSAFFIPCNTYTDIHITPETTALDVVQAFLHKFDMVDNVSKFKLYHKRTSPLGKESKTRVFLGLALVFLHKLDGDEKLWATHTFQPDNATPQTTIVPQIQFILKDHVEAEILWDSFSIPELYNFLQILNYEESQGIGKIKAKYDKKRKILTQILHLDHSASNGEALVVMG